jgi:hypothetical protein
MRFAIITLVAIAAITIDAGSANALPPTYFTNPGVVYPSPSYGVYPNYYSPQFGYYSPTSTSPGYSFPNYNNSNQRYSGVTGYGLNSGSGTLHPAPMSWQFAAPGYRRWNR